MCLWCLLGVEHCLDQPIKPMLLSCQTAICLNIDSQLVACYKLQNVLISEVPRLCFFWDGDYFDSSRYVETNCKCPSGAFTSTARICLFWLIQNCLDSLCHFIGSVVKMSIVSKYVPFLGMIHVAEWCVLAATRSLLRKSTSISCWLGRWPAESGPLGLCTLYWSKEVIAITVPNKCLDSGILSIVLHYLIGKDESMAVELKLARLVHVRSAAIGSDCGWSDGCGGHQCSRIIKALSVF